MDRTSEVGHTCDPERVLDFTMFGMREEIAALQAGFSRFLESPLGQFERWVAAREVRRPG